MYIYDSAKTLNRGTNPYIVWRTGEATTKSISYLPLYILIGQIPMLLGFSTYDEWTSAMRPLHLAVELGIGLLLYKIARERRRPALGIFGAALWFFNAITIKVWEIQQIDSIVVFFAIWALYYAENRPNLAGFLLGCSIGIKVITLFLVPLFVLMRVRGGKTEQSTIRDQITLSLHSLFFIALVPLIISLPFLIMDYQSFLIGSFVHGVSEPRTHIIGEYAKTYYEFIKHLNLERFFSEQTLSILQRTPIILGVLGLYIVYWIQRFDEYLFTSFVFAIYLYLGPVVFIQYFVWPIAVILAAIISRGYVTHNNPIGLKSTLQKVKQTFERENKYWTILFVILLTFAGFSRLYYVFRHLSIQAFSYLISDLGIGVIIYQVAREKNRPLLGVFSAAFWFFNQATIHIFLLLRLSNISTGLFFAVLAIYLLKDQPDLAKLFFGIAIVFSPFMLLFVPLFVIGPGSRTKLFANGKEGPDNYLWLKQVLLSFVLLFIIPIGLFTIVKTDYHAFFKYFSLELPYFIEMVLCGLLIAFYLHRNELNRFAYATLVAVFYFSFTADKLHYFTFFWFIFVILYAVGGDFTPNYPFDSEKHEET